MLNSSRHLHGIVQQTVPGIALAIRPCNYGAASEPLLPKVARCIPVHWASRCIENSAPPVFWRALLKIHVQNFVSALTFYEGGGNLFRAYKNEMIWLIFSDLSYDPWKISNFTLVKGKMSKFFLFLPITRAKFSWFYLLPGGGQCIPGLHWELSPPLDFLPLCLSYFSVHLLAISHYDALGQTGFFLQSYFEYFCLTSFFPKLFSGLQSLRRHTVRPTAECQRLMHQSISRANIHRPGQTPGEFFEVVKSPAPAQNFPAKARPPGQKHPRGVF